MLILPEKYLNTEKNIFKKTASIFKSAGNEGLPEKIEELSQSLDNPFTILIAGEYNSGKSTFINALLGSEVLATGVTPTTDKINIITGRNMQSDSRIEYTRTENRLVQQMDIVDTPGTNSIFREHQEIAESYIKLADFIIFLTSTERPLTESEVSFLKMIKGKWDRKLIFCINKIDLINSQDSDTIHNYVKENLVRILGITPEIFLISSRKDKKGISEVFDYLLKKLSSRNKVCLKLTSPLRSLISIIEENMERILNQLEYINTDLFYIDKLDSYINVTKKDILENISHYRENIDDIFSHFIERMLLFIDETINLGFVFKQIFRKTHIRLELEKVLNEKGNPLHQISMEIDRLSHFTSISCKSLYSQSIDYITNNITKKNTDMNLMLKREYVDREKELYLTALENSRIYRELDIEKESMELKENISQSFRGFITMQGLAVGTGITLVGILQGALIDLTGIVLSITLAGYGFILFPYKRRKMKKEFQQKSMELKDNLWSILSREMSHHILEVENNIKSIFSSHRTFLLKEKQVLTKSVKELELTLQESKDLSYKIEKEYS